MATLQRIRINTDASMRRHAIYEDYDCVIADDFLQDPLEIVEFAAHHADEFSIPESDKSDYPGLLLGVDDDAMTDIYHFIRSKMTKRFPFLRGGMNILTYLSMVTLQPYELSIKQRLCHTDPSTSPDRANYAAVMYLFENEGLGGTSFYRWKDYDLLQKANAIELEDSEKALAFLQKHSATYREPSRYITGSNEIAELLYTIPARFNRLVFYSGDVLHSAAIAAPELLSNDFRKGRLTLVCFVSALPK